MMHDGGRRPLVEDNLWWKITFGGRQPSVEDDLLWETTFGGRRPLVEDDVQWKMTFVGSLHAAYSALRHFLSHMTFVLKKNSVRKDFIHVFVSFSILNILLFSSAAIFLFKIWAIEIFVLKIINL